ncbi:MAG: 3'-5' exonuclease [Candidatus Woesearchaeota archaeon]
MIQFFLIDISYKAPYISLFGKLPDGSHVTIYDEFYPYVLVDTPVEGSEPTTRIYRGEEKTFYKVQDSKELQGLEIYERMPAVRRYMVDNDLVPLSFYEMEVKPSTQKVKGDALVLEKIKGPIDGTMGLDVASIHFLTEKTGAISYVSVTGNFGTKIFSWRHFQSDINIEFVSSEADLIDRLKSFIDRIHPDALIGFRLGIAFAYLVQRAKKYRIKLELGKDYSEVFVYRGRARIRGLPLINISRLANLAGESIDSLSPDTEDPLSLALSTLKNAKQAKEFFDKEPFLEELVRLVGLPITDVSHLSAAQMLEWHMVRMAPFHKQLIPDRKTHQDKEMVRTRTGEFHDIYEYRFKNLFPTIVIDHNVSLETLDCSCCDTPFCKKKKGFIAQVLDDLVSRQLRIEQILKNKQNSNLSARNRALQIIINGFKYNRRWYSESCWNAIREIFSKKIDEIDSVVTRNNATLIRADEESFFTTAKIDFPELESKEHPFGLFLPEAYILKSRVKGLNPRIPLARTILQELVSLLVKGKTEEANNFLCDKLDNLDSMPLDQFIFRTQLKKELSEYTQEFYHVRAAKQMKEKGYFLVPGMIIQYIVAPGREIILPSEAQKIDTNYYVSHLLKFLQPILDFYNLSDQESLKKYVK